VRDGFQVVFIQKLYSKLNNLKSTHLSDLKFLGKMHFHKRKISKIWLQKTKHVKSYCALLNNY